MGATMRLGSVETNVKKDTLTYKIYNESSIFERHRHRLEVNKQYISMLENAGMIMSGISVDTGLVDIIELNSHRWFIGCQFCPEFKSKPFSPHPLFSSFIQSAYNYKKQRMK